MDKLERLKDMEVLVGDWAIEVIVPSGEQLPGGGRCTFEWHDSQAYLVQRSTVASADAPDSVSIIGCDAGNGTYTQLYSDDRGVCRVYEMSLNDNVWRLQRDGDPFPQRFVGTISADRDAISGRWEKAENGIDFTTDFHLNYRRIV
jgi:hypothetical protein